MSSSKTANLQLNQWAAGDSFLREEFNEDNGKIDAAIQRVAGNPVVGVYTGNGTESREIDLGFRPRVVYMLCARETSRTAIIMFPGITVRNGNGSFNDLTAKIYLTEQGFHVGHIGEANTPGHICNYIAFR